MIKRRTAEEAGDEAPMAQAREAERGATHAEVVEGVNRYDAWGMRAEEAPNKKGTAEAVGDGALGAQGRMVNAEVEQ